MKLFRSIASYCLMRKTGFLTAVLATALIAFSFSPGAMAGSIDTWSAGGTIPSMQNSGTSSIPSIPGSGSTSTSSFGSGMTGTGDLGFNKNLKTFDEICGRDLANQDQNKLAVFEITVTCFQNVIEGLAEKNIEAFSAYLGNAVSAVLMLAVIFMGIKVSTGLTSADRVKTDFIVFAIKASFVAWLIYNSGLTYMWSLTQDVYNGAIALVISPADIPGCPMSADTAGIWSVMDCLLTGLMGFSSKNGFGTTWQGVSMASILMGAKLFENTSGSFIFAIFANAIVAIIMAFARIAFIYMLSMVGLILLYTISPLVIPMMLFQRTAEYFKNWYQAVISMIMQVVIMFAFFTFAVTLIYQLVMKPPDGIVHVYKKLQPSYQVSQTQQQGSANYFDQALSLFSTQNGQVDDKTKELIFSMISIFIIGYLLLSFVAHVGEMARELAGSARVTSLQSFSPGVMAPGATPFTK